MGVDGSADQRDRGEEEEGHGARLAGHLRRAFENPRLTSLLHVEYGSQQGLNEM
jgi:hypothetical protein